MTTEQKQLLIKDLSVRLSHGVRCLIKDDYNVSRDGTLYEMDLDDETCGFKDTGIEHGYWYTNVVNVKPYLRSMDSMTEKEKKEYCDLQAIFLYSSQYPVTDAYALFDWLNAHHFDVRHLIEKGLALPATEDMYNF